MKNLLRIYKIMLRHYGYLLAGLFFMLGYAIFSGASITMAIPFFDNVFSQSQAEPLYTDFQSLYTAFKTVSASFFNGRGVSFFLQINNLKPVLAEYKVILTQSDPMLVLKIVAIAILLTVLVKNIFYYFNRLMFTNLNGRTIVDIRNKIMSNYLSQSLKYFTTNRVGDSLVRMVNDVEIVSNLFIKSIFEAIRDFLLILVFVRIAIYLNLKLFLLSLVILPVTTFLITNLGKKIKKYAKRIQTQFSDIYSKVEELLTNIKVVKAFGKEKSEYQSFTEINQRYFKYWRKAEIYSGFNVPISELNGAITGIIILLIGGKEVVSASTAFTLGEFTAFLFAIFSMLHPIKTISKTYNDIKKAMVSLNRISEVMFNESDLREAENPIELDDFNERIEFDNVTFAYCSGKEVIKNVSFTIAKGEKVAIVGSSGSGKTTLANLLLRLYDVDSGEIRIDGIPIKDIRIKDLRNLFGIVTQESLLFTDTVAANIRFGTSKEVTDDEVRMACRTAYADEFVELLPNKYDEFLYSKGTTISGGQKQRLCIARAIVGNPPILVFDEATSSLDTEAEKRVQDAIERATKSRTVFIIAHRLSTVLSSDKILVMENGTLIASGSHSKLLEECPRYRTLYELQFNV